MFALSIQYVMYILIYIHNVLYIYVKLVRIGKGRRRNELFHYSHLKDTKKVWRVQHLSLLSGTILGYSREISWEGNSMTGLRAAARFLNVQEDREEDELP